MEQEYYLGLDMGTGSVGWAVTDSEYHVLRKHGKALWGVRLFESASTAEERRMFRTSRRRLDRRNWRIEILQEIFAEEISKKDPGFFLRMKANIIQKISEISMEIVRNCHMHYLLMTILQIKIIIKNFRQFIISGKC